MYDDTLTIEVGVNSKLDLPSIVCVGENFNVEAEVLVGVSDSSDYEWTSLSDFTFLNPNSLNSQIEINGYVDPNDISTYELEFMVTNDNNCWEILLDSIPVLKLF